MADSSLAAMEEASAGPSIFLAGEKLSQTSSRIYHKENGDYLRKSLFHSFSDIYVVHSLEFKDSQSFLPPKVKIGKG
jgi:hypothetical protein